jgi:hypothetical protein
MTQRATASQPTDVKVLAQAILNSPNATYPLSTSDGYDAGEILRKIVKDGYSTITSSDSNKPVGTKVNMSVKMLQAIKEAVESGVHMPINCLTNGGHTGNSNHYNGQAIDLDGGMAGSDFTRFNDIAGKYGGAHNGENPQNDQHWHFDFDGGSSGGNGGTIDGNIAGSSGYASEQMSIATSFTGQLQFPGIFDALESQTLRDGKGMMNDVPLLPFVEQLAGASLRHFMSLPNGQFYAFYPDYFGSLGKQAYWQIADVEVISGRIDLSDAELYTHIFVVGDVTSDPDGQVDLQDKMNTGGIVTIFDAFSADFLNGTTDNGKSAATKGAPTINSRSEAISFLNKYGARPLYHEEPLIRAPVYEAFRAYQMFCLKWAEQFKVTFEFTFMPELYPGGLIEFAEHGLQCYVSSVTHNCSYENGFTTHAELMSPSAVKADGVAINQDRQWVNAGMIRPLKSEDIINFNPTTNPIAKNRKDWKPGKTG